MASATAPARSRRGWPAPRRRGAARLLAPAGRLEPPL